MKFIFQKNILLDYIKMKKKNLKNQYTIFIIIICIYITNFNTLFIKEKEFDNILYNYPIDDIFIRFMIIKIFEKLLDVTINNINTQL